MMAAERFMLFRSRCLSLWQQACVLDDALGLDPILLRNALVAETLEVVQRYKHRVNYDAVPATVLWTADNRPGVLHSTADAA
jgi:hypothetical protein